MREDEELARVRTLHRAHKSQEFILVLTLHAATWHLEMLPDPCIYQLRMSVNPLESVLLNSISTTDPTSPPGGT